MVSLGSSARAADLPDQYFLSDTAHNQNGIDLRQLLCAEGSSLSLGRPEARQRVDVRNRGNAGSSAASERHIPNSIATMR